MGSKGKSSQSISIDQIREHASRRGVTILLDGDGSSPEAQLDTPYSFNEKDRILLIVLKNIKEDDKPVIFEIIRKVFDDGELILKDQTGQALESYQKYIEANPDKRTLEFFKDLLDKDDLNALKMALFLRSEQQKGENVAQYKQDIRERFGERGATIANLCTAGYFEDEFMPLHDEVSEEQFLEYYELAVSKKARALFVHANMTQHEIEQQFLDMVAKGIKYHMEDFRVHGMGAQNVKNIQEFFKNLQKEKDKRFVFRKKSEQKHPPAIEYLVTFI